MKLHDLLNRLLFFCLFFVSVSFLAATVDPAVQQFDGRPQSQFQPTFHQRPLSGTQRPILRRRRRRRHHHEGNNDAIVSRNFEFNQRHLLANSRNIQPTPSIGLFWLKSIHLT